MQESRNIEFKRSPTRTFLKTVSAYANYGTGTILFGVDDDGSIVGLDDASQTCLAIENAINDAIVPPPRYTLEARRKDGRTVIALTVFNGPDKPYLYRGKAYRRSDTSDMEVDRLELGRLVLAGQNLAFEELPSKNQELSLETLAAALRDRAGIEDMDIDVLKTLRLYSAPDGYDNAAAILADRNGFAGTDVVRFGRTDDEILDRERFVGISALAQLTGALDMYRKYYQYEKVEGARRQLRDLVPESAFREAMANALVHRLWDSPANVQVSMRADGITVSSPGGLPPEITFDEYVGGHVSILRNPIVGNVFYRLDYIEMFGTGIARIRSAYEGSAANPRFSASDNLITVELPIIERDFEFSDDESAAFALFGSSRILSRSEVESALGISQAKAGRLLNSLVDKGAICKTGAGRATKYST